ncbi:AMP-binding protein, partial [Actinomycetota bacterium]
MADSEGVLRDRLLRGSLVDAFAARAATAPGAPAVHDRIGTLSYGDLAGVAFGIGHQIVDRLSAGSEPVLILMSQGARAIATTLGVLSAGKYYVPFDQRSPVALLRDVVAGIRPRLVLADPDSADMAADLAGEAVIVVAELDAATAPEPPVAQLDPAAAAYIYFTSGSTGQPKGVVDTHHNVLHNAYRYITTLGFDAADCMSLIQSPAGSAVVGTQFGA